MGSWHFNPIGGNLTVVVLCLLGLMAVMLLARTVGPITAKQQRVLMLLRLGIFLAIVAAMLRPTYVYLETKKQAATIAILIDQSRSMLVPDVLAASSQTRWDALRDLLQEASPTLADLSEDLEIKFYKFDSALTPIDFAAGSQAGGAMPDLGEATGTQSAIGAAIDDVLRREAGKRLAGIVLLSDGAQQAYAPRDLPPETAARRLEEIGCPLYTLTFGQATAAAQSRDATLAELQVPSSVFVKNQLEIKALATLRGFVNQDVPVQVLLESGVHGNMEVMNTERLRATQDGQQLPVQMSITPEEPGERKLTLRIPPQDRELITSNNELSTFVTVLKGGVSILYLEGDPRFEQVILTRSLGASPDIKIDRKSFPQRGRDGWPLNFADDFEPGRYDVVMIGDLDSSVFRPEDLAKLRDAVHAGTGLMMLGGLHSFWGGGYQHTPLAEVLPVQADQLQQKVRQSFGAPIRKDLHIEGDVQMVPNARFGQISFMMLAPEPQNQAAWRELPPLDGANLFGLLNLKPTAQVFAESTTGVPLLMGHQSGSGRVVAFAGDSTRLWWMQGHEAAHKRFWRQLMLWLAQKDDTSDSEVWIRLAQRRFTPGSQVRLTTGARTESGEPIDDAQYQAFIRLPDGEVQPLRLSQQNDEMQGIFYDTQQIGDYAIEVQAAHQGQLIGRSQARFLVYEQDLELDNPAARPTLMAHLASITQSSGGRALASEQLPELLDELRNKPRELELHTESRFTPWDNPLFFLLLVTLLIAEWYLRKRWGLV